MMGTEAGIAEGDKIGTRDGLVDGKFVGNVVVTGAFVTSKVGAAAGEVVGAGKTGVVTGEDVGGRVIRKGKMGLVVEVGF